MAINPEQWTQKTREAFVAAQQSATAASNPEVTPEHLLLALVGQQEGIVLPILQSLGHEPLSVRNRLTEKIEALPSAYGTDVQQSRALVEAFTNADGFRICLLYTSPSPRDRTRSRMPSSA